MAAVQDNLSSSLSTYSIDAPRYILQALPEEILENIANQSGIGLLNLRLTSRESTASYYGEMASILKGKALEEFNQFWQNVTDQNFLRKSGQASASLCRAFNNLTGLKEFDIFPNWESHSDDPEGLLVSSYAHGLGGCYDDDFLIHTWLIVLNALVSSDLKPDTLSICKDHDRPLPPEGMMLTIAAQPTLQTMTFENLAHLDIRLEYARSQPQLRLWIRSFTIFLRSCVNLNHLQIYPQPRGSGNIREENLGLAFLADCPTFPKLHTLMICGAGGCPTELVKFIERHQKTLKNLEVWEVSPLDSGWESVLESIVKSMDLDRLYILVNSDPYGDCNWVDASKPHILDAIQDRIRKNRECRRTR